MIPEGKYMARAVRALDENQVAQWARLKRSASGKPYVLIRFGITEEGPHKGQEYDWNGWLTPAAAARTMDALQLMGLRGDDLRELASATLDKPVAITIRHEEYKGVFSPRVAFVNAPNDEFDADALDALADRVKAAIAGGGSKGKAKAKPKEPEPEDDIPW